MTKTNATTEIDRLRELVDNVKCGHKACRALVRAVKQLTKGEKDGLRT